MFLRNVVEYESFLSFLGENPSGLIYDSVNADKTDSEFAKCFIAKSCALSRENYLNMSILPKNC
jgi:hypothetical protein